MALCPQCGSSMPDGSRYCKTCGYSQNTKSQITFCRRCGKMLPADATRCDRCADSPDVTYNTPAQSKKNLLAIIAAVAAVVILLVAVLPRLAADTPATSLPGNQLRPVETLVLEDNVHRNVSLTVWMPSEFIQPGGWLEQILKRFEQDHPNYTISWSIEACGKGDVTYMLRSEDVIPPDVFLFNSDNTRELLEKGIVSPLEGQYLEQVKADNCDTLVDAVSVAEDAVYGFPVSSTTFFMYYNKSVYSEDDIRSLNTMLDYGWVSFPMSSAWHNAAFFTAAGSTFFGEHGYDLEAGIQVGGDAGYAAAETMILTAQNRHFVDDANGVGEQGIRSGDIHAWFSGSWSYSAVYSALGDATGVAMLPTVEVRGENVQMKSLATADAIGVNPNSANRDIAMQLASYLASWESQLMCFDQHGTIPAAQSLRSDPLIAEDPVAAVQMDSVAYASVVQPNLPEMEYFWGELGNFGSAIIFGEVDWGNYHDRVDALYRKINSY